MINVSNISELNTAIETVTGGETIVLAAGDYGSLVISNESKASSVSIVGAPNHASIFSSVEVEDSQNWVIDSITVHASDSGPQWIVEIDTTNFVFKNSIVRWATSSDGWSQQDWLDNAGSGIILDGSDLVIKGNEIYNIDHAIHSDASNITISGNTISEFRGDGIRTLGDDVLIEDNSITNCVDVDSNHDDAIQSWSDGNEGIGSGFVSNVTIRRNYINGGVTANRDFQCNLQGLGLFDGTFRNWTIENNVIVVNHWHGISVYGSEDVLVQNNTVIDRDPEDSIGPPWVLIGDHKNGTEPSGGTIQNNLADKFTGEGDTLIQTNQKVTGLYSDFFVDPENYDLQLRDGSGAIDTGTAALNAPSEDFLGNPRPQGSGIDVGAFEFTP